MRDNTQSVDELLDRFNQIKANRMTPDGLRSLLIEARDAKRDRREPLPLPLDSTEGHHAEQT